LHADPAGVRQQSESTQYPTCWRHGDVGGVVEHDPDNRQAADAVERWNVTGRPVRRKAGQ